MVRQHEPPLIRPVDSPQWTFISDAERQAMSVAQLQVYRQRRLCELEQARARIKEIQLPAALDVQDAIGEMNQTKQLLSRIELDIFRVQRDLNSRSAAPPAAAAEESDGDDVMIDVAPPDPQDVQ